MEINMGDLKVMAVSTGSIGSMTIIDTMVMGQPIINVVIGFLTAIYLLKRIFTGNSKSD